MPPRQPGVMTLSLALDSSPVLELRQYTLHPGQRETLIELFDREFVDPQETEGMRVLGQFRDLDAPDRFVWLRGFPDLATRAARLGAFYGGPVWNAHREAANATMIDSDNVLLLRPVEPAGGFLVPDRAAAEAPVAGTVGANDALVTATVYLLRAPASDAFVEFFDSRLGPVMAAAGAPPIARFRTEYARNEFPRLPVREGEHAFVWFSSFASIEAHDRHRLALARALAENPAIAAELERLCASPPQQLRLSPTARSLLRHREPVGYTRHRRGGPHDFDFIAGAWTIANRKLRVRNAGSTDWDEFPSTHHAALHLDGIANVEEIACPARGWLGMAVRHFRLADRQWSIHWISSTSGAIEPAVVGGFHGDRGEFYGEDRDGGRPVKVRFVWSRPGPTAARWEQSFSYDDGPWELNWVMDFTRVR
jgi:NIPSNAP protein